MTEFQPILSQADFDERIKARLAREREKWEKESPDHDLRAQLEAKDQEIAEIQREHHRADVRRAVIDELGAHGVIEQGRTERILRHLDLDEIERDEDGSPRLASIRNQLADISRDMPELLDYRLGSGSGPGSKERVLSQEKPLTEEDVSNMSREEINTQWGIG